MILQFQILSCSVNSLIEKSFFIVVLCIVFVLKQFRIQFIMPWSTWRYILDFIFMYRIFIIIADQPSIAIRLIMHSYNEIKHMSRSRSSWNTYDKVKIIKNHVQCMYPNYISIIFTPIQYYAIIQSVSTLVIFRMVPVRRLPRFDMNHRLSVQSALYSSIWILYELPRGRRLMDKRQF